MAWGPAVLTLAVLVALARLGSGRLQVRPTRAAWVLALIGGALYAVSRTTGSGWLVVLLAGLVATAVVSLALPLVALRGIVPTLEVRAGDLRVSVPALGLPPVAVDAPATGVVEAVPARRRVVRSACVDVVAAGPLGLWTARRHHSVGLARPLEVGPRPVPVELASTPVAGDADQIDDGCRGDGNDAEMVRGARAYVAGDPLRLVHWPATARAGTLMVRELESPGRAPLTIVVDLRGPEDEAEAAAGRAAGLALAALRAGVPVTLATAEVDGPVLAAVSDRVVVGRRLARAVAGVPPQPVPGRSARVIRVAAS
jgi:uncharacterized protein (DUF58 family)